MWGVVAGGREGGRLGGEGCNEGADARGRDALGERCIGGEMHWGV